MDHSHHGAHTGHDAHAGHGSHDHENMATTVTQAISDAIINTQNVIHNHDAAKGSDLHSHMSMTFHGGYSETVLFDWWKFDSIGGLIASILGIFVIAVLYEGLKYYREYLFWRTCNSLQYRAVQPPEEKSSPSDEPTVVHMIGGVYRKQQPSMCSKFHTWQTFLHAIQVSISYLLMLIFMTYNSWLCLAVVAGATCGNFLFGWKKSVVVDITEHCH